MTQFVASSFGELGVQSQYLDGELHLVDDALAGWLIPGPKLKIRNIIESSVAIFVMNRLYGCQRAAEMFRHYVAVLRDFSATSKMQPDVARLLNVAFGVDRSPRTSFPAAFLAAEFLLHVVAGMATVFGSAKLPIAGFAAQFTLKCRSGLLVHIGLLRDSLSAVNGNLGVRNFQVDSYTGG
jgi:hypothetical protein